MKAKSYTTNFAGRTLTIETSKLALQAHGACTVRYGDTVVLATAVMGGIRDGVDFFPLSVEYEERLYAAGKIKGSRWIKREGRPSDDSVLTGRLIDRCIRPLFSKELKNEVQVIVTVLSFDGENDPDVPALIAASTALAMSNIPWGGPLLGARVALCDGTWVVNPTFKQRITAAVELLVSGRDNKLLMVEAEGMEASEAAVYDGIALALKDGQAVINLINDVVKDVGVEKISLASLAPQQDEQEAPESAKEVVEKTQAWLSAHIGNALFGQALASKGDRKAALQQAKAELMEYLEAENIGKDRRKKAAPLFDAFVDAEISRAILEEGKRVDGRSLTDIRPLSAEVPMLPRTHGSALFMRGETQILSIVTLGSPGDEQTLEGLEESTTKRFMHHYNFPPFSVGETGRMTGPGRREIGHGALAEKALRPLIPSKEIFPYTIRLVSEVLGSNGSSSMGSVCGSSLALMDAGVPIPKAVAGIAMGLASNEAAGQYKVLTDLQDLEDGAGGMDFKIAGTKDGITAIQLDTKTSGIPLEVIKQTLEQGRDARLRILEVMDAAIAATRAELSEYAPRIVSFKIDPERIREVIGPGGKIINKIIAETGVQIDIEEDGTVMVTSVHGDDSERAVKWIQDIVREIQVGEVFTGKVSRLFDFGAMVEMLPGKEGMVHVSELAYHHVNQVSDAVNIGDEVTVKVINIDEKGRVNLSIKALLTPPEGYVPPTNSGRPSRSFDRGPRGRKPRF